MNEAELKSEINRMNRELVTIRSLLTEVMSAIRDAESEIPEKMRRFIMYMHDVHDVSYMYEERGHQTPQWILREMERCDDRYRQLLEEAHLEGGTFAKVRAEMAKDTENRWDHTRLLTRRGTIDETRNRELPEGGSESRTPSDQDLPSRGEPNGRGPG